MITLNVAAPIGVAQNPYRNQRLSDGAAPRVVILLPCEQLLCGSVPRA
jgi:hypothetical protein